MTNPIHYQTRPGSLFVRNRPRRFPPYYTTLYWYRHHKHVNQADLARQAKVSRRTIHSIETQKTIPNVLTALRIADALGYKVEDLFKPR